MERYRVGFELRDIMRHDQELLWFSKENTLNKSPSLYTLYFNIILYSLRIDLSSETRRWVLWYSVCFIWISGQNTPLFYSKFPEKLWNNYLKEAKVIYFKSLTCQLFIFKLYSNICNTYSSHNHLKDSNNNCILEVLNCADFSDQHFCPFLFFFLQVHNMSPLSLLSEFIHCHNVLSPSSRFALSDVNLEL